MAASPPARPCRPWRWITTPRRKPGASRRHWIACCWHKIAGCRPMAVGNRCSPPSVPWSCAAGVLPWPMSAIAGFIAGTPTRCSGSARITSGTNRACSMCSNGRWGWISTWCWIFSMANCALNESFVLLSDGIWAVLGDTAIAAILRDQPDLEQRRADPGQRRASGRQPGQCQRLAGAGRCPR